MAVVSVKEIPAGWEGEQDNRWHRTYQRVFRVRCDNRTDGPVVIRKDSRIPKIGTTYVKSSDEYDLGAFVASVKCSMEALTYLDGTKGSRWLVTVPYGPYEALTFPENPLDSPIKSVWSAQKFQEPVERDVAGDPILNAAFEPYAEQVMRDASRPILTVVRNEAVASYDAGLAQYYRDKINNAAWNGFDAFTVKIGEISTSDEQYDSVNQIWYYAVRYVFEFDRNLWKEILLEQGYSYLDGSSPPKQVRLLDKQGQFRSEPTLLDASGHELLPITTATPVFTDWDIYDEADFSLLKINLAQSLGR